MASLSSWFMWQFRSGRFVERVEGQLGRPLSDEERRAFAEDTYAGWWETSMMLILRPDLVGRAWRELSAATYSLRQRLQPNYTPRGSIDPMWRREGSARNEACAFSRSWAASMLTFWMKICPQTSSIISLTSVFWSSAS